MKTSRFRSLPALLTLGAFCAASPALTASPTTVEYISAYFTHLDPWERFAAHECDGSTGVELRFKGVTALRTGGVLPNDPVTLYVQFDWVNPIFGWVEYSPPFEIAVPLLPEMQPIDVLWTLDFCPEQVSLHLACSTLPEHSLVAVAGEFTHTGRTDPPSTVPESTGSLTALGFSLAALAAYRRVAKISPKDAGAP